jgi:bifunctional non-homologous end joining protein LigD
VEVEDADGRSVVAGRWIERRDGTWALRLLAHLEPDNTGLPEFEPDNAEPDTEQSFSALAGVPAFAPMLATPGGTQLPQPGEFAFEFKFDGVRTIARVGAGRVQLASRAGNDVTTAYPELAVLGELLAEHTAVLDGEIVALEHGVPSFRRLQRRMHVHRPTLGLRRAVPVALYLFDVLFLDGVSLVDQPYVQRRLVLHGLTEQTGLNAGQLVQVSTVYTDVDGEVLMGVAREKGLEGVIAKRVNALYRPGVRSADWVKFPLIRTTEAVVCGWRPGTGRRAGGIGSVLLGAYTDPGEHHRRDLVYIGHVGTGFSSQALAQLQEQLTPLQQPASPFDVPVPHEHARDARWVRPTLVADVAYKDFGGDRLRLPVWRGLRPDRAPDEVHIPHP